MLIALRIGRVIYIHIQYKQIPPHPFTYSCHRHRKGSLYTDPTTSLHLKVPLPLPWSLPQCRPPIQLGQLERIRTISRHTLPPHLLRMHLIEVLLRNRIIRHLPRRIRKNKLASSDVIPRQSIPRIYKVRSKRSSYDLFVTFTFTLRRVIHRQCMEPAAKDLVSIRASDFVAVVSCYPWFSVCF
jgi:hypothetical protein